jgi:hypothetical protein
MEIPVLEISNTLDIQVLKLRAIIKEAEGQVVITPYLLQALHDIEAAAYSTRELSQAIKFSKCIL